MATLFLAKRNITNTSAPATGDLSIGELAVNVMDSSGCGAILYTKSSEGCIVNLTSPISSGSINDGTTKSIPFFASNGKVLSTTDDSGGNGLFWDSATDRMGINTNAPTSELHISGTGGIVIPVGTTAQRGTATQGKVRYNTSTSCFEGYDGSTWGNFATKLYVDTCVTAQDVDATGDSGTIAIDLDSETLTVAGGVYLTSVGSGNTITINHDNSGVTAGSYGSATAIPAITVDAQGHITALSTNSISTSFTISDGSATDVVNTGETLTFTGGTGITTAVTGNTVTITRDALTLGTHTSGNYVSTVTAGTGLTSTGATSGEGIAHSLSVDASQTQITGLGTIGTGVWQGTAIADGYIASAATWNAKQNALTFGIANTNTVTIDHASVADNDYAKFTASGLEGRSVSEVKSDLAIALGTDTSGNYVAGISGTANEIEVSGSGSEGATVTIGLPDDVTITGNLTVNGTTTQVNSTVVTIDDPIFTLGGDTAPSSDDNKDRGVEFRYYDGSAKLGFFGYNDSNSRFMFIADATNTSEVFSGTLGNAEFGTIYGTIGTATQNSITSASNLATVGTITTGVWNGTAIANANLANSSVTVTAGDGLSGGGVVSLGGSVSLAVGVDDSSIETNSDVLRIKASGVTNAMLAGSIANSNLANSAITINGSSVSLGGTRTLVTDDIAEDGSPTNLWHTTERVQDVVGGQIVTNGSHTGISFAYDDANDGAIDATVNATLGTDTSGSYVGTLTAGTGLTSTGNTTGEGIVHSLSVDASQTQITGLGTIGTGVWQGTAIADAYIYNSAAWNAKIDTGGTGLTKSGTTLNVDAAQTQITSVGTLSSLTIAGDLTVNGTTTTINSTTVSVDDKNIELGSVATPSDTTADGGGITLKGASDKTILWTNSTDAWHFNQGINVTSGNVGIGCTAPADKLDVCGKISSRHNGSLVCAGGTAYYGGLGTSSANGNCGIQIGYNTGHPGGIIIAGGGSGGVRSIGYWVYNGSGTWYESFKMCGNCYNTNCGRLGVGTGFTVNSGALSDMGPGNFDSAATEGIHIKSGADKWAELSVEGDRGSHIRMFDCEGTANKRWFQMSLDASNSEPSRFQFKFINDAGSTAYNSMTLCQDGKVGIGTTAPDELLHIKAAANCQIKIGHHTTNLFLPTDTTMTGPSITWSRPVDGAYVGYIVTSDTTNGVLNNLIYGSRSDHVFMTSTGERFRVDEYTGICVIGAVCGGVCYDTNITLKGYNDTWTMGLDHSDSQKLKFSKSATTGSSTAMTFDDNLNVGIGTASPSEQLHLLAPTGGSSSLRIDSCADGAELQLNDIAGTVTGMWTLKNRNGDGRFGISTGSGDGTDAFAITTGGNVGIGTTAPANKFHVQDSAYNMQLRVFGCNSLSGITPTGYATHLDFWSRTSTSATTYGRYANIAAHLVDWTNGALKGGLSFSTVNAGTLSTKMYICPSGEVGIGTVAPAVALDVNGNAFATRMSVSGGASGAGGCNYSFAFYNNSNSYFNGAVTVDDILTISAGFCLKSPVVCSPNLGHGNNTVSGTNATGVGYDVTASGSNSTAFGICAKATVYTSNVFGYCSNGYGCSSIVVGYCSCTTGTGSTAVGVISCATGNSSSVIGYCSTASGNYSTASGAYSTASGSRSTASGYYSCATGTGSTVSGFYSCATAIDSSAFGRNTKATGSKSSAFGFCSHATGGCSTAVGWKSCATGSRSTASGYYSCATGIVSTASGFYSCATGTGSSAFGWQSSASGTYSSAHGRSMASGVNSTASGYRSCATGASSTAMGMWSCATGGNSVAIGINSCATVLNSSAFGNYPIASGIYSSAFGYNSCATGQNTSAVGHTAKATGNNSIAVGYFTTSSGTESSAFGKGTTASGTNSTAVGHTSSALATSSTVIGYDSCAATSATYSVAVGYCARITNTDTTAVGVASCAIQTGASAFGRSSCATGEQATASGYKSCATGAYSTASGRYAVASANYTQAFGASSTASAVYSTAVGNAACAAGGYSQAFGRIAKAMGGSSVAVGRLTCAAGTGASAFGKSTCAMADWSTASGYLSCAMGKFDIAVGAYAKTTPFAGATNQCPEANISIGFCTIASNGFRCDDTTDWYRPSIAIGSCACSTTCHGLSVGICTQATGMGGTAVGVVSCATGTESTAIGRASCATGGSSTASGYFARATGSKATASGFYALASGGCSSAFGHNSQATGTFSSVFGYLSCATGACSTASGYKSCATGADSSAFGSSSCATGTSDSAFGHLSCAEGGNGTAVGYSSCAWYMSSAFGSGVSAGSILNGGHASAFGNCSDASGCYDLAIGYCATTVVHAGATNKCPEANISIGFCTKAQNGFRCDTTTDYYMPSIAIGTCSCSTVCNSLAVGICSCASQCGATVIGICSIASFHRSTAVGLCSCATGDSSSAFGKGIKATGSNSTSVGFSSCSTGPSAQSFGYQSYATANQSVAVGFLATSSGAGASVFGYWSNASGLLSSTFGSYLTASGGYSTAVGSYACATGGCSTAVGYYSKTRIACTANISQPLIHKKDSGETQGLDFAQFSSAETTLMTKEIDLEVAACHTITIPAGATFWVNEMGVISTAVDTLTTQATVSIGCDDTHTDTLMDNLQTVELTAAKKRERYIPNNAEDGLQTITVEIATGATATTAKGRFYFKGMLVEDE